MDRSQNPVFIRENNLKLILHPVEYVDVLFPVYTHNKGGLQKTRYILSTEDFLISSNEK